MGGGTIPKHIRYKSTDSPTRIIDTALILENYKIKETIKIDTNVPDKNIA